MEQRVTPSGAALGRNRMQFAVSAQDLLGAALRKSKDKKPETTVAAPTAIIDGDNKNPFASRLKKSHSEIQRPGRPGEEESSSSPSVLARSSGATAAPSFLGELKRSLPSKEKESPSEPAGDSQPPAFLKNLKKSLPPAVPAKELGGKEEKSTPGPPWSLKKTVAGDASAATEERDKPSAPVPGNATNLLCLFSAILIALFLIFSGFVGLLKKSDSGSGGSSDGNQAAGRSKPSGVAADLNLIFAGRGRGRGSS